MNNPNDVYTSTFCALFTMAICVFGSLGCNARLACDETDGDGDGDSDTDSTGDDLPDIPGDGDGDPTACVPGTMYCPCSPEDLNEDGETPPGGECFPGLECDAIANVCIEAGGDGDGDGDPTGDGDGDDAFELFAECDDDGRCWVRRAWWTAWAQLSDPEGIQAGLDGGTLTPVEDIDGAKCYQYGEPPGTMCALGLDGVNLHARPLDELDIVSDSDCAGDGPWSSSFSSTFWCYGRLGSLGVALRDIG